MSLIIILSLIIIGIFGRKLPYPIISWRISFNISLFNWWLVPKFKNRNNKMSELDKCQGTDIWWFQWLFLEISFGRLK